MTPLVLTGFTAVNSLGYGLDAIYNALRTRTSGLAPCHFENIHLDTYAGEVSGLEDCPVSGALSEFDCRNNRLAQLALRQDSFEKLVADAVERYGAERIAVVIGTSTSGILETEHAYRRRAALSGSLPADYHFATTHNLYSATDFVRRYLALNGPATMVSTACSSSAKVFASAERMLRAGLCDAAVVGGVDSLCLNTLYGFASLGLIAPDPCRPCASDRHGISIGEAAGFALVETRERVRGHSGVALLGYGESADAYHMSTPDPEGGGAALAMQRALECARLEPGQIDYVNMHGTASVVNDAMEDKAIAHVLGTDVACSSTKGWTGHALGAAGITEAVISALCIRNSLIPGCLNTTQLDPAFTGNILLQNHPGPVQRVLSNSFGFGGSNCSLIFGAVS